jgi:drug/metabolite transporter (DMT)-like permease
VNPVVAVLLGIFLLHERPQAAEFVGMAVILVAVFLVNTAQVKAKRESDPAGTLEPPLAE